VLSSLAAAHGALGDAAAAAELVAAMDRRPPFPFSRPEQELGRAWASAAAGDLPGARATLLAAAEMAASLGYHGTEAWLLHDVVRLGDPAAAAERLDELAMRCEGTLVAAYAAHAAASLAGQGDALVEAADGFERVGARLLAAEAVSEAAQAFRRHGDGRAAATAGVRAAALAESCQGARTPAVAANVLVVPLTPRERDIAVLAAQGASSRAIADHLFLSVRTVNNHLQSAYSKLGVSGRRQLAAVLAPRGTPPPAPPAHPPASTPR
jgi:DNA-binding CsgD family transcriptional regulator